MLPIPVRPALAVLITPAVRRLYWLPLVMVSACSLTDFNGYTGGEQDGAVSSQAGGDSGLSDSLAPHGDSTAMTDAGSASDTGAKPPSGSSQSFSVRYSGTGNPSESASTTGAITASDVTASSGLTFASNYSHLLDYYGWPTDGDSGCDGESDYYELSLMPNAGLAITSVDVTFTTSASTTGPAEWGIFDNASGAFALGQSGAVGSAGGLTASELDVTGTLTIRIYGCQAQDTGGSMRLDSLAVTGTTQ
jgi:hypothetical protein